MKCNEATQGYCANADQDGNCYNVDCEAYREDTVKQWKVKTIGEYDEDFGTEPAYYVIDSDSLHIADLCHYAWEENKANARLIAAAPELLQQCIAALKYLQHPDVQAVTHGFALSGAVIERRIEKAIAKAEGKED